MSGVCNADTVPSAGYELNFKHNFGYILGFRWLKRNCRNEENILPKSSMATELQTTISLRDVFSVISSGDDKVKMNINILYELPLKRMHNPLNHEYSKCNQHHRTWRPILKKRLRSMMSVEMSGSHSRP